MSRFVYLVTHGTKMDGPNPGLTPLGEYQTAQLREHLPSRPKGVVCGTGKRHLDSTEALGLVPTRYTGIVGMPESKIAGKSQLILPDGTILSYDLYTGVADRAEAFRTLVNNLAARTVIITSRSMIRVLNDSVETKAAAVYRYNPGTGELTELFAATADIGDGNEEV